MQWLAYPSEEDGKRVKTGRNPLKRGDGPQDLLQQFYCQPFKNPPKTFIAMSAMDFGYGNNLRFKSSVNAPTNYQLAWKFGTWDDTDMYLAEVQWIAIE